MILKSGLDVGFSVDWRCKKKSQNKKIHKVVFGYM